ncbi:MULTISPECIES: aromatic ring-hydroxylating dioxygenase subunit alpha [unclassified Ruegeria]|uniref:aromatic ring-hydroxylating oxygenase subunit alpha n=1 Tax=unclassified Ruegeria TaxID=2625375 RepID=UPI001491CEF5|nr:MULTISPECIES: aromatic ring-hydroxylating dioxygenase subunit alpha [unclassified Ruegeria]NOD35663.1 Rieske 2Fe-2S domain-containing protein [Ruegeria sp. HKCCD7296]NOD47187.1 Rieske 2Fe-2S domain-containing protein [Ruegeria sp. HKCCD5849]NOD51510.1 Rieske 2Fe-2S domain-containing protein [Ruegeria sp. HKCCD5851]NOD69345.1 Rieske 2Fe-2S domain-containing protein [Ruegeria sp. HKCCD7303]NOE43030.1 Rieske 2Fe-2S domain-containing protein [Ruegeria sp. HKCCD7319]
MSGQFPDTPILKKVKALLGEEGLVQTFAPIEEASGLPNAAYWSKEWLALEQEHCFRRSWVFAGADAELPERGDMKPVDIGGAPLIILRDQDGAIRALHNVCRHRGAKLVTEPCKRSTLTCPYHAWVYGLNGKLRARPHFNGPDITDHFKDGGGDKLDLQEVRCEVWNGCVFVNISGDAEPLEDWLKPMLARTPGYDFTSIRWAGKIDFEVNANWKLVYENYMEGYHVFAVHPKLLKFAPMNVRWSGEWDQHVFYNDYIFPELGEGRGDRLPHYPDLSQEDAKRGLWFLCFPHFAAEVFPDQFTVLVSYPIAPNKTREELHVFLIGDAATSEDHANARAELMQMWDDLNREDLGMLELLQQGRLSPAYDGGRLSPYWEGPTHEFGRRVVERILS